MSFELNDTGGQRAVIKVLGVGGCGGNVIKHMVKQRIAGVDFLVANTDAQALEKISPKANKIQIGLSTTKGLGAGAKPQIGRDAALEDKDRLREVVEGCDMLFITAGMGGGTGTGAAPIIAEIARELNILTVAVVTTPFKFEGKKRSELADEGIVALRSCVDSLITIPNDKILTILGNSIEMEKAFSEADKVLQGAVQGIAELITKVGRINLDFADVKTVMSEAGTAMMGTGMGTGIDRAEDAYENAIKSPLLDDIQITNAKGLLVNITSDKSISVDEYEMIMEKAHGLAAENATIVIGQTQDNRAKMKDTVKITIVATGLNDDSNQINDDYEDTYDIEDQKIQKNSVVSEVPTNIEAEPLNNDISENISKDQIDEDDDGFNLEPNTESLIRSKKRGMYKENGEMDHEYLDIPAFLRNQQD